MQQGMRISASGAMVALYRTDLHAANLANVDTVAFKPDSASIQSRLVVREEDNLPMLPSDRLLEKLGAGVLAGPRRVDFAQGPLQATGNDLDLALEGRGFFMVRAQGPDGAQVRLTRDGRLTRNSTGQLVQAATGLPVLSPGGSPIVLPDGLGPVAIDHRGVLTDTAGRAVGQLAVVDVPDPTVLHKAGHGLYQAPPAALAQAQQATELGTRVHQRMVEGSAVDPIKALLELTDAGKAVASNTRMIGYHDQLLDQAINTFARVA
ncbi:MAG: flagellar basal body protein [Phycisphaerales bacterium]|nr:MAG: flagellar basal body protein [Phycisphaerales bacterium]